MEESELLRKVQPLRVSILEKKENLNWKKLNTIFMIVAFIATAALIVFLLLSKEENSLRSLKEINPDWKPAGDRLKTRWGVNLDPNKVWQEYPRPQLERKDWINLNGLWKYAVKKNNYLYPDSYDGYILVPFALESSLSGVMKDLKTDEVIFYETDVTIPDEWNGKNLLLNFGAVDWKCELFINRVKVGEHTGGYAYFYFDITKYITDKTITITLRVTDVTDSYYEDWGKYQPVGKQTLTPAGIWYTPASGVWQTVWLEPVSSRFIEKIYVNNNYDNKEIKVTFKTPASSNLPIEYAVKFDDKVVASGSGKSDEEITINVSDNFKPWSPAEPNMYIITAELKSDDGSTLDTITSYTTLRKISSEKDSSGKLRIFLNGKPLFNLGPLDQGYWPDGIYTPPSEEAMLFDMQIMKDLGFNTLRKHAKTEPFRYYYQCDKMGFLVWQDMPHGNLDGSGSWDNIHMNGGTDTKRTQQSKDNYYKEWEDIIENLKFFQCIVVWTPFNEAWGQFDTEAVVEFTQGKDNTRLINAASGGNHRECGNFVDMHTYPGPSYPLHYDPLINVIGEYGGIGLEIKNHTWINGSWSYNTVDTREELTGNYTLFINNLINMVPEGISAAIYTQVTDVEGEINGLITYDRYLTKIYDTIKEVNKKLIDTLS